MSQEIDSDVKMIMALFEQKLKGEMLEWYKGLTEQEQARFLANAIDMGAVNISLEEVK
jgi:hypothetical protein